MRHLVLPCLLFALLAPVWAESAAEEKSELTIEEAVRIALDRYPEVGKARAAADVLKGRIREVRAQALPEVNINSNYTRWRDPSLLNASGLDKFPEELRRALVPTPVNLFDYAVTVKQPLYTAGKVGTALRLASIEAEGASSDIDRAQQDLAISVVKAAYDLMTAERLRDLVAETQEQRRRQLEIARTRYRNGVATEVDVLRSEVAVANVTPELVRAENGIRQARALVNFYLVRPIEFPTRVRGDFQEQRWEQTDLDSLTTEAFRRRPELVRLRISERSAAAQLDLAKAENRLRLDFNANYGIMSRLPENLADPTYARWTAGVNFTFPVFDGFKRSGLVWQATANQRAAHLEREKVEQQIRLGLQQGLDEITAARETITAARANQNQAERVVSMMEDNYKYGAATTLDVLEAQNALTLARMNLLRGLRDYSVARASLKWTIGANPWE
ncbi:MAG TPA: TolC family protein [Bryobacteraceae bacterium]|nr:TolC family protein [Bryobacteraceae bacterium]